MLVLDDKNLYPTITEQAFNKLVQQKNTPPFLMVFTAEWLGEGTIMDAIIEGICGDYEGRAGFYRVDIEESKDISQRLGIRRLPAMFFFKEGEIVDHFSGMMPKSALMERLNNLIGE